MNLAIKKSLVIYDQKFRFFKFAENFARYQAPEVIFLFIFKRFKQLPYGFEKYDFINLRMKKSEVIYNLKFRFFNFAENFAGYQAPTVIFLFIFKKFIQLPYGFKNQIL